jgi:hypothetical protein
VNEKLGKPTLAYADFISMYLYPKKIRENWTSRVFKNLMDNKNATIVVILIIIIIGIYKLV